MLSSDIAMPNFVERYGNDDQGEAFSLEESGNPNNLNYVHFDECSYISFPVKVKNELAICHYGGAPQALISVAGSIAFHSLHSNR
jgi:hypothetical protein